MLHRYLLHLAIISIITLGFYGNIYALTGVERAQMIEAARVDCYAQMVRQIKGMKIGDSTLIANHVTANSVKEAFADAVIKGAVVGEPEFVGDICIINGSITIEQIVENLTRIKETLGILTLTDITNVKRYNTFHTIRSQGTGTIKSTANNSTQSVANSPNNGLKETLSKLDGDGQQKLGAIESARVDAYAQLARQLKGVQLTDESIVLNMASNSRWTETNTNALVKGAKVIHYTAVEKDLVSCVVSITMQRFIKNVKKVVDNSIKDVDIRIYSDGNQTFTATGYGAVGNGVSMINSNPTILGTVK